MSPTETAILEALATYRFLTTAQLHRLGVAKNQRHIQQALADMAGLKSKVERKPRVPGGPALIHAIDYGRDGSGARIHRYWHLTETGGEHMGVDVPSEPAEFKATHTHRRRIIDLHITVRQWAELHNQEVRFFHTDFWEKPKIQKLQPDAVFQLVDLAQNARLFAAEVYCDNAAQRPARKLNAYLPYLDADLIEKAYRHRHGAVRVLVLFTQPIEVNVRERLLSMRGVDAFADLFFFRTLPRDGWEGDFRDGWHLVDGIVTALFPLSRGTTDQRAVPEPVPPPS